MILHGDLFDVLPTLEAESFDSCVTDPPYGIGFMGREWDTFKPDVPRKQAERLIKGKPIISDNPNLHGRRRSPAISESQICYDRTLHGQHQFQTWTERWALEVLRVMKPGAYLLVCGAPRSFHRMTCGIEDAGFEVRDCLSWLYGQGFPKSLNLGDGLGTALKPGWEPIILARKPVVGTVAANVQKHGTGALNIETCRLGESKRVPGSLPSRANVKGQDTCYGTYSPRENKDGQNPDIGRWPANVVLDEDAAAILDEQSGELTSGANPERRGSDKFRGIYSEFKGQAECEPQRGLDVGGASRFFYCAKPSRAERDLGCEHLETRQRDESRKEGNPGGDNPRNRGLQRRGNFHPTVKPLALMRWLVRLVTPPGGKVLDPFAGSGTTGMACAAEGFDFTLIEREAEYVPIIEARVGAIAPLLQSEAG
jgi:DNA modification methylase